MGKTTPIDAPEIKERRGFLTTLLTLGTLGASYGLFGLISTRFLHPSRAQGQKTKMFVGFTSDVPPLASIQFTTPRGERFLLTNTGADGDPYQAFSSLCPHLGCKVHWEGQEQHFVCPCHGGIFDAEGRPQAGPPAKENQHLKRCEIVVEGSSLYAMVDVT